MKSSVIKKLDEATFWGKVKMFRVQVICKHRADKLFQSLNIGDIVNLKYDDSNDEQNSLYDKYYKIREGTVQGIYDNFFVVSALKNKNIRQCISRNELICKAVEVIIDKKN